MLSSLPPLQPPSFDNIKVKYENDKKSIPVALVDKNFDDKSAAGVSPIKMVWDCAMIELTSIKGRKP